MAAASKQKLATLGLLYQRMLKQKRQRRLRWNYYLLFIKRRLLTLAICCLGLLLATRLKTELARIPRIRSCRRVQRNTGWWKNIVQSYTNNRFKQTFRISRHTFDFILERIRPDLIRKTIVEEPISPECRLAICLYRLGRGDYPYTLAEMTGFGESTIRVVVLEVCNALIKRLWGESIAQYFPTTREQFEEKILDTEQLWQFPCCWGAIDGCHLSINCPPGGQEAQKEYHNFKNFFSVVLMAMVDAKCRFIWASVGCPGNSHDSIILQSTKVWEDITSGNAIPQVSKKMGNSDVFPFLVGDSAFPLSVYLMKPFTDGEPNEVQKYFNYRLSRSRMVVESAFGQLKSRWRVLFKKCESSKETVKSYALACVILHNICIERGETLSPLLDLTVDPATFHQRDRCKIRELLQMRNCTRVKDTSRKAASIRNDIAKFLWTERENALRKQGLQA